MSSRPSTRNEGEGNKTAARRYNREATRSARAGKGREMAPDAERALDSPEADEMHEAEERGRRPSRGVEER
jgi:hypothetical protein